MTQSAADPIPADAPPKPIVKKMRWPVPFIWLVPLCALAAAGYYLYQHHEEQATQIILKFDSAEGLRVGQTPVTVLGVPVGKVAEIELSADQRQALVHVDLQRPYVSIARQGALFWIVRPDFSDGNLTGLGTVVSGPYIEAVPGVGEPEKEFVGLAKEPVSLGDGLIVLLHADQLQHLQPDSPVYYRGVQVGVIQGLQLSSDSTHVEIRAVIRPRYAALVTAGTKFWSVSGADIEGGIFSGISVKLDSLRALLTGGVAFATPEDHSSEPVKDGAQFTLNAEAKKDWLTWSPKISLPPEQPDSAQNQQLQSVGVTSTITGK
jgi:paraquat-inducible protein B